MVGRLEGRVGIITGAAQGIGREFAHGAAAEGASVVAADIVDTAPVVAEIETAGGSALGVGVDIAEESSTEALAAATVDRFGRIDFLVNNAAIYAGLTYKSWLDIDVVEWDRVMAVNLRGTFLTCKAVGPTMISQGYGKIINISSGTALTGVPFLLHYVTSKGGVIGFTRALARELGPSGIAVNSISPGLTMSKGSLEIQRNSGHEAGLDQHLAQKCLQRAQQPSDLVGAMIFLASADSDFISNQTINVDGGWVAH